jgi:hypothetical protein
MARILSRVPIPTRDDLTFMGQEQVRVRAYEILVWVSLQPKQVLEWQPTLRPFPAILDTAHTHNFSIQQDHLVRWAGLRPENLHALGNLRHTGRPIPLYAVNVWLHGNVPGQRDQLLDQPPHRLELRRGIAIHPPGSEFPRLPLLGLRALLTNRLHLSIAGDHSEVTLRSPDWRTWLLRFLA